MPGYHYTLRCTRSHRNVTSTNDGSAAATNERNDVVARPADVSELAESDECQTAIIVVTGYQFLFHAPADSLNFYTCPFKCSSSWFLFSFRTSLRTSFIISSVGFRICSTIFVHLSVEGSKSYHIFSLFKIFLGKTFTHQFLNISRQVYP